MGYYQRCYCWINYGGLYQGLVVRYHDGFCRPFPEAYLEADPWFCHITIGAWILVLSRKKEVTMG